MLVGFQIALSTLLVIGAGLFLGTLAGLGSIHVGFRTDHLLLVEINPEQMKYPAGKDVELHKRLQQAFAAVPGIDAVTPAWEPYIADDISRTDFVPEGIISTKDQAENYNFVGSNFFETLGIPMISGRSFTPQDTANSLKVGVINQSLARKIFPDQNPLGKRFSLGKHDSDRHSGKMVEDWIQIVGVCADTRYASLRTDPPPQFFLPFVQQQQVGGMTYEIRTGMKPEAIIPALRNVMRQIDPDIPLANVRTQDQQIEAAMQQERVFVVLTSGFGILALVLASVGIYGIMAYSVSQRINEIGIRLALGAKPTQVRAMILRESSWVAGAGIVAGLSAALVLARMIQSLLFGIRSYDPVAVSTGVTLLLLVALAASWIPARRATGVQPMQALRHE